jgi:hypothetical protein
MVWPFQLKVMFWQIEVSIVAVVNGLILTLRIVVESHPLEPVVVFV